MYRKWTIKLSVTVLLLIFLTIIINYIANPYGVFNHSYNKIKEHSISSSISKFYYAKKANPEVLIMGTSRAEHIYPGYLNNYLDGVIYNLSIKGSGVTLHRKNIEYFINNHNIKTIVYGLDFFSFNPLTNKKTHALEKDRYSNYFYDDYKDSLLGIRTLEKSILTIRDNIKNVDRRSFFEIGWDSRNYFYKKIKSRNQEAIITKFLKKELKRSLQSKHIYNNEELKNPISINESLNEFKKIVNICMENNVRLYVFISPIYKDFISKIYEKGYKKTYFYWKKSLSKYNIVYDFSGFNNITLNKMNYIDGSHYQKKIAEFIIDDLFKYRTSGNILKEKTIDKYLSDENLKYDSIKSKNSSL